MIEALKKRWRSKTYRAGLLTSLIIIAEAQQQVITSLIPEHLQSYMPLLLPVIFLILREFTTEAIEDK